MQTALERLKHLIGGETDRTDEELNVLISTALSHFLSSFRAYGYYHLLDKGIDFFNHVEVDHILLAALFMYSKSGGEGQISHNENGISRTWDTGLIPSDWYKTFTSTCGIVSR